MAFGKEYSAILQTTRAIAKSPALLNPQSNLLIHRELALYHPSFDGPHSRVLEMEIHMNTFESLRRNHGRIVEIDATGQPVRIVNLYDHLELYAGVSFGDIYDYGRSKNDTFVRALTKAARALEDRVGRSERIRLWHSEEKTPERVAFEALELCSVDFGKIKRFAKKLSSVRGRDVSSSQKCWDILTVGDWLSEESDEWFNIDAETETVLHTLGLLKADPLLLGIARY